MILQTGKKYRQRSTGSIATITGISESRCQGYHIDLKFSDGRCIQEHELWFTLQWDKWTIPLKLKVLFLKIFRRK